MNCPMSNFEVSMVVYDSIYNHIVELLEMCCMLLPGIFQSRWSQRLHELFHGAQCFARNLVVAIANSAGDARNQGNHKG